MTTGWFMQKQGLHVAMATGSRRWGDSATIDVTVFALPGIRGVLLFVLFGFVT
jgi:hypothetical protein